MCHSIWGVSPSVYYPILLPVQFHHSHKTTVAYGKQLKFLKHKVLTFNNNIRMLSMMTVILHVHFKLYLHNYVVCVMTLVNGNTLSIHTHTHTHRGTDWLLLQLKYSLYLFGTVLTFSLHEYLWHIFTHISWPLLFKSKLVSKKIVKNNENFWRQVIQWIRH